MKNIYLGVIIALMCFISSCDELEMQATPSPREYDMSGFAKGADVSWTTQMEASNISFHNALGQKVECMHLMRDMGMNSIRLRVWVEPENGWCNKEDLLVKAYRASKLGMRLLIDFHYSDNWADPGKQTKPAAWEGLSIEELKTAVSQHTTEVLTLLKDNDIEPEWVQIGNETNNGMLWDEGKADANMANFASLVTSGYDAAKAVFPNTEIIVHVSNANNLAGYNWIFDGLKVNGGKWDIIGMSYYPTIIEQDESGNSLYKSGDWETYNKIVVDNINNLASNYASKVMVCEFGMPWTMADEAYDCLNDLMNQLPKTDCLGLFYWEPQAYNNWEGYQMGAFDDSGKPTKTLAAFAIE